MIVWCVARLVVPFVLTHARAWWQGCSR